jgi:hypothetical protein
MAAMQGELGSTGRSWSSIFQYALTTDEYLQKMTWPNDIAVYSKMSRSDAQIKAMLLLLELPIRSTAWFLKPADDSAQAKKNADFIEDALFTGPPTGMQFHFEDFIKNACSMFTYGHAVFEKVFEVKDSFLKWKKFAIRPVSTIYDLLYNEVGDLSSIQQYNIQQGWQIIDIPLEKAIIFSHDIQDGDYRGRSVLRAAYKHWVIKDFLYKITNIGLERNMVGTPVINLPPNYTNDEFELAKKIVTNLRSSEYGGVILPDGFLLDIFEGKRTLLDALPFIEYQDTQLSRSILAQFLNLGSTGVGSFALSSDQTDLFLMMLNASAKYIANNINSNAIPQLVQYNFNSDLYPTLCFKPLGDSKLLETLKLMVDGKIILPDENLEEFVREMLELPEKADEPYMFPSGSSATDTGVDPNELKVEKGSTGQGVNKAKDQKQIDDDALKTKQNETASVKQQDLKATTEPKKLSEVTNKVDWAQVDKDFSTLEGMFKQGGRDIVEKQLKDFANRVSKVALQDIAAVQIGFKGQMTTFVKEMYTRAFKTGVVQMQNELGTNEIPKLDDKVLTAKASIVANNISERVKTKYLSEYMLQKGVEGDPEIQSKNALKAILG